jgi:hypothetical protein
MPLRQSLAHRSEDVEVAYYKEHNVCWNCGSMTPELAIFYLKQPGTKFSGDNWRHGFPERFFITPKDSTIKDHRKFRVIHLLDASDEVFQEFDRLSRSVFGVAWFREPEGIRFNCPRSPGTLGFQRFGYIGPDGSPIHQDGMNQEYINKIIEESEVKIAEQRAGTKMVVLPPDPVESSPEEASA